MVGVASRIREYEGPILSILSEKGWNAYRSTDSMQVGSEEVIRRGPATDLQVMERYVVLPVAQDPRNPIEVMAAFEIVASRLCGQTPPISIDGERFSWVGFIPRESDVKVATDIGHYLEYPEFINSLGSILKII